MAQEPPAFDINESKTPLSICKNNFHETTLEESKIEIIILHIFRSFYLVISEKLHSAWENKFEFKLNKISAVTYI